MSLEKAISSERLSFTVFVALAVHAIVILGIGFSLPDEPQASSTLNITLATHQAQNAPEKADYLAQFDQEASGTEEQSRELTTREYAEVAAPNIHQVNPNPKRKTVESQAADRQQLTTDDSDIRVSRAERQDQPDPRDPVRAQEEDNPMINPEIASLRAKLDRLQQEMARRPRIRRMTSVATKSSADAAYLNAWTQKVEVMGNQNFPKTAIDQGIFGSLRLSVIINHDGTVEEVEILKPSGYPILDQAALQIVRLASPFQPFPPEIRKSADQLDIIRTWRFEITGLTTGAEDQ